MNPRGRNMLQGLVVLAAAVGFGVWLLFGGGGAGKVGAPDISRDEGNDTNAGNFSERDARPPAANNTPDNAETPDPPTQPGNDEEYRLPEAPDKPSWNPEDFANTRLPWRLPVARADAQRPEFTKKYNGTPVFLGYAGAFRVMPELYGDGGFFDPARPDGMLVIEVDFIPLDESEEWRKGCVAEATSHDGAFVYRYPEDRGAIDFAVPYSYRRTETVGLRITGPNMLPAEAIIGQAGLGKKGGGAISMRESILTEGLAKPNLRVFPADYNDFREILVTDGDGNPVKDAMLTYRGVQIFGRSDANGLLRYPWPANTWKKTRENFFFLSAPGYVPVLLERPQLEKATAPVNVTLRARELLVSVYETVPNPDVLRLGANLGRHSSVLDANADVVAIPTKWDVMDQWTDAIRTIWFGCSRSEYDDLLAKGESHSTDFIPPYGNGPPSWRTTSLHPYTPGHELGDESARKLADALGREPTEHWPMYARWYYGRWDYVEREGRFDVVLPFPGRFLLAVGEYNHGPKNDERNGKLTHVLYIDARDPANVKSKLLIHPRG